MKDYRFKGRREIYKKFGNSSSPVMVSQSLVRQGFLWGLAVIYLFAFTSLYIQIPGLYGDKGILPVSSYLKDFSACRDKHPECIRWALKGECNRNTRWMTINCRKSCQKCQDYSLISLLRAKPTLLWLTPWLGLDASSGMEFLCLVGIVLSMVLLVSQRCRDCINFFVQKDGLLLETGFLTIFIAPWNIKLSPWKWKLLKCNRIRDMVRHHDTVSLCLIKWLLFRLMFASGVVKLSYMDPTWWSLTAMYWHYESQCIPTPVAWYFQKLPKWFHRLSTVTTYVIEIGLPFLFFIPVRSLRIFAYCGQVLLQLLILITGNYNFFNLLTIVLCISLLDDNAITTRYSCQSPCTRSCGTKQTAPPDSKAGKTDETPGDIAIDCPPTSDQENFVETSHLPVDQEKKPKEESTQISTSQQLLEIIIDRYIPKSRKYREFLNSKTAKMLQCSLRAATFVSVIGAMLYLVKKWFYFELTDGKLMSWIAFSPNDFTSFVTMTTVAGMWLGFFSLMIEVLEAFTRIFLQSKSKIQRNSSLIQCTAMSLVTLWLFAVSLVPLTDVSRQAKSGLPVVIRKWYQDTKYLEIAHPYGLFRSMTGVGGRPEIIILGSNATNGTWMEYNFRYKPGNLYQPPPFTAPHQPRLDWQMWFAALESFESNPWFLRLLYKLLQGEKDVLRLMGENPQFANSPPKYIRTQLYLYHFTQNATSITDLVYNSRPSNKAWWTREYLRDYTPFILSNDSTSLLEGILHQGKLEMKEKQTRTSGFIYLLIIACRHSYENTAPQNIINLVFFIVVVLLVLKVWWRKMGKKFCTPKLIRVKEKCEPPLKQATDSLLKYKSKLSQRCTAATYQSPLGRLLRAQCFVAFCEKLSEAYKGVCLMLTDHWNRGWGVVKSRVKTLGPTSKKKE